MLQLRDPQFRQRVAGPHESLCQAAGSGHALEVLRGRLSQRERRCLAHDDAHVARIASIGLNALAWTALLKVPKAHSAKRQQDRSVTDWQVSHGYGPDVRGASGQSFPFRVEDLECDLKPAVGQRVVTELDREADIISVYDLQIEFAAAENTCSKDCPPCQHQARRAMRDVENATRHSKADEGEME